VEEGGAEVKLLLGVCLAGTLATGAIAAEEPRPEDVVKELYAIIVARQPLGIPTGDDKAAIWPLLSRRLIRRLETAKACEIDCLKQVAIETQRLQAEAEQRERQRPRTAPPGPGMEPPRPVGILPPAPPSDGVMPKPPYAWLEEGIFSGRWEKAYPSSAVVERARPQGDGSFRVSVRFTWKDPFPPYRDMPSGPINTLHWRGVVVVRSEDGRFVVDDVLIYDLHENSTEPPDRLTETLKLGCDGPRWVGYKETKTPTEPSSGK